jgi:histidyl-tRNA synthetase
LKNYSKTRNEAMIKTANKSKTKANAEKAAVSETEVKNSFYSKAKHLIGSIDSGVTDLSTNKKYLEGFGRSRNADNR